VDILGRLDGRSLLKAAPTTCKAWNAAYKGALDKLDVSCATPVAKARDAAACLQQHGHCLSELCYNARGGCKECRSCIFPAVLQLTQLQSLDFEGLYLRDSETQALTSLQHLTSLRMANCFLEMQDLGPLSVLVNLRKLNLDTNMDLDANSPHFINLSRALTQLTSFSLADCDHLHNPRGLSELKFVQELDLSLQSDLELADLPALPFLTKLTFKDNSAVLDSAETVKALSGLQHLDMRDCYFGQVSALGSLVSLTRLEAVHGRERGDGYYRCVLLTALGPLQQLRHLVVSSDFKQADPISSFSVLGTLQHLTHLELRGPQLPAGALAAMFSTRQGGAGAACLPRLQCLQMHKEEGWNALLAPGGPRDPLEPARHPISRNDIALLVRSCPALHSLTLTGYLIEDAGFALLSGLTGLTALTFEVNVPGKHRVSLQSNQ
jgi:hypothetical protein